MMNAVQQQAAIRAKQQLESGKIWSRDKVIIWWFVWVLVFCSLSYFTGLAIIYTVQKHAKDLVGDVAKDMIGDIAVITFCVFCMAFIMAGCSLYLMLKTEMSNEALQLIAEAKQHEVDAANGANTDGHDDLLVPEIDHEADAANVANNDGDEDLPVEENDDDDVPIFEEAEDMFIVYGE